MRLSVSIAFIINIIIKAIEIDTSTTTSEVFVIIGYTSFINMQFLLINIDSIDKYIFAQKIVQIYFFIFKQTNKPSIVIPVNVFATIDHCERVVKDVARLKTCN